ncbi:MAG: hypothetical protein HZB76_04790 [Chlamydiae bacterium]|nr:hypothetical protein [Chlamydiota bacterium]
MKKIVFLSLASAVICLSAFAISADFPINSKPWENFSQDLKVVNVYDLTNHDLNEIMQGKRPEVAIEFSAETTLPISFFIKGDLINLVKGEGNVGQIEVKQTFYARYIQDELILSSNLREWKPFLEFITGEESVSLSTQDGQPSIVFGAETNKRK